MRYNAIRQENWFNCYRQGWGKLIVSSAYEHPAKFSRGLIERIYDFGKAEGYWAEDSTILDPFGGVALGGIIAMLKGYNWVGVELESNFVDLGKQNIKHVEERYGKLVKGNAVILHGDSRYLRSRIGQAMVDGIITSPSYIGSEGQLLTKKFKDVDSFAAFKSKRSYRPGCHGVSKESILKQMNMHTAGALPATPGQLGAMKEGDFDAAITSPSYIHSSYVGLSKSFAAIRENQGRDNTKPGVTGMKKGYGSSAGQIANLPEGQFDSVITSPPYEEGLGHSMIKTRQIDIDKGLHNAKGSAAYGQAEGQIGQQSGDTYWKSVKAVYQECHQILKPGGVICVVVKSFVRDHKLVNLPDMTLQLLEHIGFQPLRYVKAWLIEEGKQQQNMFRKKADQKIKERKGFFRRNHETKVRAANYWQTLAPGVQSQYLSQVDPSLVGKKRERKAMAGALEDYVKDGGSVRHWDDETIIDYEVVLFMRKEASDE